MAYSLDMTYIFLNCTVSFLSLKVLYEDNPMNQGMTVSTFQRAEADKILTLFLISCLTTASIVGCFILYV